MQFITFLNAESVWKCACAIPCISWKGLIILSLQNEVTKAWLPLWVNITSDKLMFGDDSLFHVTLQWMKMSSTHVISSSSWANTFMKEKKLTENHQINTCLSHLQYDFANKSDVMKTYSHHCNTYFTRRNITQDHWSLGAQGGTGPILT